MQVNWIKCENDNWCPLETVNLDSDHFNALYGVYVIWFAGEAPNVVRVGQGHISDRIYEHRNNPEITRYSRNGELFVTWATVPEHQQDGVEVFLANELAPLVGSAFPDAQPVSVNLPGQEQ